MWIGNLLAYFRIVFGQIIGLEPDDRQLSNSQLPFPNPDLNADIKAQNFRTQSTTGIDRLNGTCRDKSYFDSVPKPPTNTSDPTFLYCNSEFTRSAWCMDWNICTDYENQDMGPRLPPGVSDTKNFYVEISYGDVAPDGYLKKNAMLINGTYPGPLLDAVWGQSIHLTVFNKLGVEPGQIPNGTALHPHGFRMWHQVMNDGVPGVTQCPIAPNSTMNYLWPVTQYGSGWYHSHLSLQYPNGVVGPMLLHGPKSANYTTDLGPILLTDWYHANPFELFHAELLSSQTPDSTLINGHGKYHCTDSDNPENCISEGSYWSATFQQGKTHLLRFVNTATATGFRVSIDGHNMTLVTMDFTAIRPVNLTYLDIAVGQRYEVIVTANYTGGDFWLRAEPLKCNKAQIPEINVARGIIHYAGSSGEPNTTSHVPHGLKTDCKDMDSSLLVPTFVRKPGYIRAKAAYGRKHQHFEVTLIPKQPETNGIPNSDKWPPKVKSNASEMLLWQIANYSLAVNWSNPALLIQDNNPKAKASDFPNYYAVVEADGSSSGPTNVIFHINGTVDKDTAKEALGNKNVAHPIHIHGHDFIILGQGPGNFAPDDLPDMFYNPTRRDVANMPGDGFLVLSFPVDNSGIWLLHCHLAWHASQGLALMILEKEAGDNAWDSGVGANQVNLQTCQEWDNYLATWRPPPEPMEDSGV